jgi:hypothetical protein
MLRRYPVFAGSWTSCSDFVFWYFALALEYRRSVSLSVERNLTVMPFYSQQIKLNTNWLGL